LAFGDHGKKTPGNEENDRNQCRRIAADVEPNSVRSDADRTERSGACFAGFQDQEIGSGPVLPPLGGTQEVLRDFR
jgi:hypothetical protein